MYTHIEENIYSIFVPLPGNPLKNLNAYLIKSESGRQPASSALPMTTGLSAMKTPCSGCSRQRS